MLTVAEHLRIVAEATAERRAAGHPMTFPAGQEFHRYALDLVHLMAVAGDYLAGDAPKAALQGAFVPFLADVEAAAVARSQRGQV